MAVASLEGRVEAALLALFGIVLEVKDKNVMYRPLMGSIKSTLDCLKPLIEDMARGNRVLDRPVKELEYFRMHMEKGVELVRKCSKNGVLAKYKKKKYTNRLLELDACLQRQLNVLKVQVSADVRETTASVKCMQKLIKGIEESGVVKNRIEMNGSCEVAEPSSPDEHNDGLVLVDVKEAEDIRLEVEGSGEVQEKSEIPNWFEVPEPPLFTVGLDVALEEIKMKLLDEDGVRKIGVFGGGGIGKTTLVKMLCHDQEVKDKFQNIFFTTASKWPNSNLIMQELYQAMCAQVPTFQNREGKCYLVVLDDVLPGSESIFEEFDELKLPNSKILITSRYASPGVGSQYHLNSLHDEDAMSLFHLSASLKDRNSYIPEDLSRKIVECCKGLPLAITVIGRSLCDQPIEIWQKRIVEWGRGTSIFDPKPEMIVCLQRSLDGLNREKTIIKECFLDLASFPEEQLIPVAALVDMWAELYGVDREFWTIANLHELTIRGLANIVSRKEEMQVDGYYSDFFVTLHHMLRGLAIHKASEDTIEQTNRLIIDIHGDNFPSWWTEQKYQPKNARLLSISTDRTFSRKWHHIQLPKVEVLVLNFQTEKYELPDFLDKMEKLKVLIVTNYGSLPAELSNFQVLNSLPNLKIIRLEGILITSITKKPIQLVSLKKTAFSKCDMGDAFNNSNSSFEFSFAFPNLVEMNVAHCHGLEELSADLGNIAHLEVLDISNCHSLATLPEALGNLSKLKMLRLRYDTNLVELPVSIGKLKCLDSLDISGCIKIMGLPEHIGEMSRLRELNISGCSRLKELPSVSSLEQLQEVILDEETERLWKLVLPTNIHARVVHPLTVKFDVALEEFNRKVLKDGVSRHFACGMAQNQTESWCPVPETSSLTERFDVLDCWCAMKMEETLISEVRLDQIEGSDSVVKNQLGTKGISGNHSTDSSNDIVPNASGSARRRSQLLKAFGRRGAFGNTFKGWMDEKTLEPFKVCSGMPGAVEKLNPESTLYFEEGQSHNASIILEVQSEGCSEVAETSRPSVGLDVVNVQGTRDVEETMSPIQHTEAGVQPNEETGVIQNQLETKGRSQAFSRSSRAGTSLIHGSLSSGISKAFSRSSRAGTSLFSEDITSTFGRKDNDDDQSIDGHISETSNLRVFSFAELKAASRNFREDSLLSESVSGLVFKGWVDWTTLSASKPGTGMVVAIKKLHAENFLGFKELQTELNFLGRLSHPNLVKLLGYCWEKEELLLVHEFMPKGSLEGHLFKRSPNSEPLSWEKRIKIAIGAARGLAFLHSEEILVILRDFKSSHILLDENYNGKLSDFGLPKLGPNGGNSHVSTRVLGTYGYAAPEYIATGHLYAKSDVYSFGVVLLEILTGLRAFDLSRPKEAQNLVEWAKPLLSNKRKLNKIMDVRMEGQYSLNAAFKAGQLTLKCLAPDCKNRPSMKEVVEELEQILTIKKKQLFPTSS